MAVNSLPRSCTAIAGVLFAGSNLVGQVPSRGRLPAVAYTINVVSTPHGGSGSAMAGPAQNYTGRAVFAANRGRMDIVEGTVESLFAKGDYVLFDSTDLVIVHPASKTFVLLPHNLANQTMERLESLGVKMTLADEKVTLDSIAAGDTVAGIPTIHYRMTTAFAMSIDAGVMQQRLTTESVTDYWIASVPGLPRNPLLRANGLTGGSGLTGMFKSISQKVDSVAKRMGTAIALKTSTASRMTDSQGANATMEQTSEVSNIERREVDDSVLVLPPDFKPRSLSGDETIPDDAGAKWRVLPRPRPARTERPFRPRMARSTP